MVNQSVLDATDEAADAAESQNELKPYPSEFEPHDVLH